VYTVDARKFAALVTAPYDIVYFDPPYDDDGLAGAVPGLLELVCPDGVLAYERSSRRATQVSGTGPLRLVDTRTFGETAVDFYAAEPLRGRRAQPDAEKAEDNAEGNDADSTVPGNL
jgi:16S rRNA G966 N2-methylase RsmD